MRAERVLRPAGVARPLAEVCVPPMLGVPKRLMSRWSQRSESVSAVPPTVPLLKATAWAPEIARIASIFRAIQIERLVPATRLPARIRIALGSRAT
jgi:hypothetical protein